jgi:CBS domain-containing protein
MQIAEIMTRNVRDIAPQRSIREAARLMDELNVGMIPVCDGGRLVGVVTDRDITVRATAAGSAPDTTAVVGVMTTNPRTCRMSDDVTAAVTLMNELQVRRIPVLDDSGCLVGIVALGDVAEAEPAMAARVLHEVSTPSEPDLTSAAGRPLTPANDPLTAEEREELQRRARKSDVAAGNHRPDEGRAADPPSDMRDDEIVRAAFGSAGAEPGAGERPDDTLPAAAAGGPGFFHDDSAAASAQAAGYGEEDVRDQGIRTVAPRVRHVPPPEPGEDASGGLEPPSPTRQPGDR